MRQLTVKPATEIALSDPVTGEAYVMRFNLAAVMVFQELSGEKTLNATNILPAVIYSVINTDGTNITYDEAAELASRMDTESAASIIGEFEGSLLGSLTEEQKKNMNALLKKMNL